MQDQDLDTSSADDLDSSSDTNGSANGGDNLDTGDRTSQRSDDTDVDGGSEPDADGYTAAERAELEKTRERLKNAGDKISKDGRRLKELEEENARLKAQANDRDSEADTRSTRTSESGERRTPPERRPNTRTDTNGAERTSSRIDPKVIRSMPREQVAAFSELWEKADAAEKRALEAEARAEQVETYQQREERERQEDAQYQNYRDHYGLTREQYDEVMQARESGDFFTSDRLLNVHSTAAQRRRQRAEEAGDDSGFLPPGSPDTPAPQHRKSREDQAREEFEDATTDKQKNEIAQRVWGEFPADVAERITLPRPSG